MAAPSGRPPSTSIFIGNVGFSATEDELSAIFKQAGPLKSFRLVADRETGKTKGYAFAEYYDVPTAQSAQRNLNGAEFNGRNLRVDFADNDKYGPDNRGPHKPAVVGKEAVNAAGQTMAAALGGSGGAGQQQISEALSKMTRAQIFEVLSQMKALIQQNPAQARQILVQNPQLTKALFQAQILLGMVSPPPAANGVQAPAQQPAPMQIQQPALQQQVGQQFPAQQQQPGMGFQQPPFQGPAPGQGGPPQPMPQQQAPQQPQQHSQPQLMQPMPRPQNIPVPMQPGGPRPFSGPPSQQQPPRPMAMPAAAPQAGPFPGQMLPQQAQLPPRPTDARQQAPFDPRQQAMPQQRPPLDPRQQQQQQQHGQLDPRQQDPRLQAPADPRQQPATDPRHQAPIDPRQQMQQPTPSPAMMGSFGPPQPLPQQQGPPGMPLAQPGLGPDQQQALLRQVMSLTPQQIEMLPEAQRQQVLDLQRQLRSQVGMQP